MTEQELLDMFIQERINVLLEVLNKTKPKKILEENEQIFQATHFIDSLPDDKRKLVENYLEQFLDGVKVVNLLGKL